MDVKLQKWEPRDREILAAICSRIDRSYLSDRLPDPYTAEDADWWLGQACEREGKDGIFRAIMVDGQIAGTISVEQKTDVYRMDAEIGYYLVTEQWSKGIMTEAVRQICEIAFQELDIIRITGLVYSPNIPSKRVLEKNGFVCEGLMKQAVDKNGSIYDLCIYGKYR